MPVSCEILATENKHGIPGEHGVQRTGLDDARRFSCETYTHDLFYNQKWEGKNRDGHVEKRPLNEAKNSPRWEGSWEDFEVDKDAKKDVNGEWCGIAVHEDNGNRVRVVRRIKIRRSPLWISNVLDLVARNRNRLLSFAFRHPINKHRKQKNMHG